MAMALLILDFRLAFAVKVHRRGLADFERFTLSQRIAGLGMETGTINLVRARPMKNHLPSFTMR
jgi:hypothetical protein